MAKVSINKVLGEAKNFWSNSSWKSGEDPLKSKEANLLKLNCDRSLSLLGWKPSLNFKESAGMTFNWYACYYENDSNSPESYTKKDIETYLDLASKRRAVWTMKKS